MAPSEDNQARKRRLARQEGADQLRLPFFDEALATADMLRTENAALKQLLSDMSIANQNDKELIKTLKTELEHIKRMLGQSVVQKTLSAENSANYDVTLELATGRKPPHTSAAQSELAEKVSTFRALFRGRNDVFAERWQRKDGSSNYSPARIHDWNSHTKNRLGRSVCGNNCQVLQMTDKIVQEHLEGLRTIGVYPLLQDDTCWFLALDFDDAQWSEDCLAVLQICDNYDIPAHLERSRSGSGGHIWIFFDSAVRARTARQLGAFLITSAKDLRFQIGFKSYDRMFPNQDMLPKGGFGNLIALPLQSAPIKAGNSVFVDRSLTPIADQWDYLSRVERMTAARLENLVCKALSENLVMKAPIALSDDDVDAPWKLKTPKHTSTDLLPKPLPEAITLTLSDMIYLPKAGFSQSALNKLMTLATFQNPEFYRMQATRQSTHDTPRVICCADTSEKYLHLPRGCRSQLLDTLRKNQISVHLQDERTAGSAIAVDFLGELRDNQGVALKNVLESEIGVVCAGTAFGKTVLACKVIAERKVSTLILVHTVQLAEQWRARLLQFTNLAPSEIGQFGGGKKKVSGKVDVALLQSLSRSEDLDVLKGYGQIIVDECHHITAFTFEKVVKEANAKFLLGLTATPLRKDGHQPIIEMQCGPIVFRDQNRSRKLVAGVTHKVIVRQTNMMFADSRTEDSSFSDILDALARDEVRNELIFDDILRELELKRSPLVLTERVQHLELLAERLKGFAKNIIVLKGGLTRKQRAAVFAELLEVPDDAERLVLATGKYAGEGFDDARLDTLFLLMPISFDGKLEQYVGRLHRQHERKNEIKIFDYVDGNHPWTRKMYEKRAVKYRKMGYDVVVEAPKLF